MLLACLYAVLRALFRLLLVRWRWLTATDIELLVLRHERRLLQRRTGGAVWPPGDRLWVAALSRALPASQWHVLPVRPATLRRWHREFIQRGWPAVGSRRRPGRPQLDPDVQALIVRLARENSRWGYVRIKGELLKLGYDVSATAIRMTLRRRGIPPAPQRAGLTWPGFLRAQAAGLLADVPGLSPVLRRTLCAGLLATWLLRVHVSGHAPPNEVTGGRRRALVHRRPWGPCGRAWSPVASTWPAVWPAAHQVREVSHADEDTDTPSAGHTDAVATGGCLAPAWQPVFAGRRLAAEAARRTALRLWPPWPDASWRHAEEGRGGLGAGPDLLVTRTRRGRAPPATRGRTRRARSTGMLTVAGGRAVGRASPRSGSLSAERLRAA